MIAKSTGRLECCSCLGNHGHVLISSIQGLSWVEFTVTTYFCGNEYQHSPQRTFICKSWRAEKLSGCLPRDTYGRWSVPVSVRQVCAPGDPNPSERMTEAAGDGECVPSSRDLIRWRPPGEPPPPPPTPPSSNTKWWNNGNQITGYSRVI